MSDLRKAAEDLLEVVEAAIKAGDWRVDGACDPDSAIRALRKALAQPQSTKWEPAIAHNYNPDGTMQSIKVKLTPQGEWVDYEPSKREWVGLTPDDVHDAFNYVEMVKLLDFDRDRPEWCEAFASACEARLKHRNGGNK